LNWERVVRAAEVHGVAPLLYAHLQRNRLLAVLPEAPRARLEGLAGAAALRALKLRRELKSILRAAGPAGLRPVVLKGAALAEPVYGDWSVRPMADLDLLVGHEEVHTAEEVLRHLGYRPDLPEDEPARAQEVRCFWERYHFHLPYVHPSKGTLVELHWNLLPSAWEGLFRWEGAPVRARAVEVVLAECPALVLPPEDLLIHLALHHFSHGATALAGFCDVGSVLRRYAGVLQWERLAARAHDAGAARVLAHALWWAGAFLQAPVSPAFPEQLCPGIERLGRRLAGGSPIVPPARVHNRWTALHRQLALLPGLRWRLRFARQALLPPPACAALYVGGVPGWGRTLRFLLSPRRGLRAARALLHVGRR
ncbi:MAG: nucleotidyltransferase family protein, partial [Armatimonadota bacterium]|nr:nucleotidyltransferase family protein [Armatimonadota bacterium]